MKTGHPEIKLVTSQTGFAPPNPKAVNETASTDSVLFLVPISFIVIWSVATATFIGLPKLRRKWGNSKEVRDIPCLKCRFFVNSPYLSCTVNPKTALKPEASDCFDYDSKDRRAADHSPSTYK